MRLKRRIAALVLCLFFIIGLLSIDIPANLNKLQVLLSPEKFDHETFRLQSLKVKNELHYSRYLYGGYENFTKAFQNDISKIKSAPLREKCQIYFNQFNEKRPDWKFTVYNNPEYRFDKSSDKMKSFVKERISRFRDDFAKITKKSRDEFILSRENELQILKEYKKSVKVSKEILQEMADVITTFRIYGKCFLGEQLNSDGNLQLMYDQLTKKLFPFLTGKLPIFKQTGEPAQEGGSVTHDWPVVDTQGNIEYVSDLNGQNIIDFIFRKSKGRGIVISATTRHARDLIRLIKLLRALNNKLPIQIMYKGDITRKNIELIEIAATADVESILDPELTSEHQLFMPDLELLKQYKEFGSEFPKQQLEFVNIVGCINRSYKYSFPGYSNKILAMLFSTFEEIILLDADTVPLVNPEEFFISEEYQKSGTYFFQDRSLRDTNDFIETNFFATLFPTNEHSIDAFFGIPRTTEKTLNNKYMTGWRHYQEAGVVAFNKRQHFMGLLMMCPLSLWTEPCQSSIWGDKELYWIGLSAAGDENYEFNPVQAASVGEKTTHSDRKFYPNSKSNEVCSTHPGHVNRDGKLLWINSGFGYCKKNGYYRDRTKYPYTAFETSELVNLFNNPLRIKAALVPPDLPRYREPGNPIEDYPEIEFKQSWKKRKKDVDEINENLAKDTERTEFIQDWGPQKGWVKSSICFGYYYCAYDQVASYRDENEFDRGKIYEFNEEETKKFDYLSKVWITGGLRNKPKLKEEVIASAEKAEEAKGQINQEQAAG